jgi:isochorismate synthase
MSQLPAGSSSAEASSRSQSSLQRRLEAARSEAEGTRADALVLVRVEAPLVAPEALLQRFPERDSVLWQPPQGACFAGIDVARSVTGHGLARVAEVLAAGAALWEELGACGADRDVLSAPRLFGGFAFSALGAQSSDWAGFGSARFVLPRVTYARERDAAVLTLALERSELERGSTSPAVQLFKAAHEALCAHPECAPGREARVLVREEPDPALFESRVADLIERIARGELAKAVAARELRLGFAGEIDPFATVAALRDQAPECVRFAFRWGAACFIGATPERLLYKHGRTLETEALAGTIDAGAESPEARLCASTKELEEHGLVVSAIRSALEPLAEEFLAPSVPLVRRLKHVLHLCTPIQVRLLRDTHVLDLLGRLHPTPAVGGVPTEVALDWIERHEPFDRGWYAGAVGWFDASGDGDFNVALRSGLVMKSRARLYAGAGIVRESKPAAEYAETTPKLATLLASLRARA